MGSADRSAKHPRGRDAAAVAVGSRAQRRISRPGAADERGNGQRTVGGLLTGDDFVPKRCRRRETVQIFHFSLNRRHGSLLLLPPTVMIIVGSICNHRPAPPAGVIFLIAPPLPRCHAVLGCWCSLHPPTLPALLFTWACAHLRREIAGVDACCRLGGQIRRSRPRRCTQPSAEPWLP